MAAADDGHDDEVRLRPRRGLLLTGILVLIVVPIPILVTVVALGTDDVSWTTGGVAEGISIVLLVAGLLLFRRTSIVIADGTVTKRGFFSRTVRTRLTTVHSVVLAHTFSTSSNETVPQLIVRDAQGGRVFRMRGIFWSEESMRRAAAALGRPLDEPTEPLTTRQYLELYPGTAYWFENRRHLGSLALFVAIGVVCAGGVLGLMVLLRLPIAG